MARTSVIKTDSVSTEAQEIMANSPSVEEVIEDTVSLVDEARDDGVVTQDEPPLAAEIDDMDFPKRFSTPSGNVREDF